MPEGSPNTPSRATLFAAAAAVALTLAGGLALLARHRSSPVIGRQKPRTRSNSTTVDDVRELAGKGTFEPPLPPPLMRLLARCSLCQLATVSDDNAPHLSLMRFTYDPATDVIVMSTRRLTKKFANLQKNKRVSLLLSDFQDQGRVAQAATGTISVTIEGETREGGEIQTLSQLERNSRRCSPLRRATRFRQALSRSRPKGRRTRLVSARSTSNTTRATSSSSRARTLR